MAAKLILSMDGLVLKEIPLSKERTTIGRKPHNDIQIDNLAISGEHAVIVTILNDSFMEDLNSTNGTYVNGQPVKKHFLQSNDVIELGKYKLKYISETPPQSTAADFEKTMVLRPETMRKPVEHVPAQSTGDTHTGLHATPAPAAPAAHPVDPVTAPGPAASPAATPAAPKGGGIGAIQILTGANAGKELELTKNLTTLGKPGVQVAVITRRPHGFFITHVEGANFPVVNGQAIDAHPRELKDHDVIELVGVKMEFFLKT